MNKRDKLLAKNIRLLIDGDEPEGTPEERAEARKFYHDHYDEFQRIFGLKAELKRIFGLKAELT